MRGRFDEPVDWISSHDTSLSALTKSTMAD
jgi:hypothetical protein